MVLPRRASFAEKDSRTSSLLRDSTSQRQQCGKRLTHEHGTAELWCSHSTPPSRKRTHAQADSQFTAGLCFSQDPSTLPHSPEKTHAQGVHCGTLMLSRNASSNVVCSHLAIRNQKSCVYSLLLHCRDTHQAATNSGHTCIQGSWANLENIVSSTALPAVVQTCTTSSV